MTNTARSFKNKWEKNTNFIFEATLKEGSDIFNWILSRNGFKNASGLKKYLKKKKRILDAGCGNGRVTALLSTYADKQAEIVGIDLVSSEVARKNLKDFRNISVLKKNLLGNLSGLGKFDFIYCQEVLHHTSSPYKAFVNLTSLLEKKGEIAIYVYKKKAPVREFVDDLIRERISKLSYEKALKTCAQITQLGKVLSNLKIKVNIPDVEVLEIKTGEYDLQRFIYHYFMKCFWSDEISYRDNVVVNYDWYHPQDCSRHTLEEVRKWFKKCNLKIVHECVDFYGITIRGKRLHI